MKTKIFYILLFFFLFILFPLTVHGNIHTEEYCEILLDSANREYSQKNYIKSIEILTELKTIAEINSWDNYRLMALNNMAITYGFISDYDKSMECYLEAYEIALKTSDKEKETMLLMNISELYASDQQLESAKEYCHKALKIAQEINDTISMGKIYLNLSIITNMEGDLDLAEKYIHSSLFFLQKSSGTWLLAAKVVKASNLYLKKEYDAAEKLVSAILKEYEEQIKKYDHKVEFLILVSRIYHEQNNIDKALYFAQEALKNYPTLKDRIHIYNELSTIYWENNVPDSAWNYKNSVIQLQDSLFKVEVWESREKNRARFELFDLEKTLAKNKAKQRAERMLFVSILVFIVILAIVLIWVFRMRSVKNKQRKTILENEQKITKLELEKEKSKKVILKKQLKEQETVALLEKERLGNENKQLAAKVLIQSNRNELIEEIIRRLSEIPTKSEDSQLQLVIRQLKMQLKESAEWDNFLTYFEQVNPLFLSSLKQEHPDLSIADIRFLSYLFLNFNTKEIASLLNISLESCKKKRQRLASKIGVKTSELYNYLLNIA